MLSRAERAASSAGAKSSLSGPKSWIKGLGLGRALVSHWPRRLRMDEALLAPPEGELTQRAVWPAALLNHLQFIPVANYRNGGGLRHGAGRFPMRPVSSWTTQTGVASGGATRVENKILIYGEKNRLPDCEVKSAGFKHLHPRLPSEWKHLKRLS